MAQGYRAFAWLAVMSSLWSLARTPASAQDVPNQTIRIMSPYPTGGLGDILPRIVAAGLREPTGATLMTENIPD